MSSFGGPPTQGANYNMGFNQPQNPYPVRPSVPMHTPVPMHAPVPMHTPVPMSTHPVPMPTPGAPTMAMGYQPPLLSQPVGFNMNQPYQNNPQIGLVPPPPHVHPGYGAPSSLNQPQLYNPGILPADPKQMKKAEKDKKKEMKKAEKEMEKLAKHSKKGGKDGKKHK